ncbi:MAG: hypothetical protein HOJ45_10400, partial [Gemmatimonadetes bacterium]|nr:hypothetical protein [Gemmatimonadota bacterium]
HEVEETPGFEGGVGHEVEETPGFEGGVGHEVEETPGFEGGVGHEVEETPGFEGGVGHEVEETPGFEGGVGHEVEETPGFEGGVGHEVKETPGFEGGVGHEVEETPGFEGGVGHEVEETPGFTPPKGRDEVEVTPGFTPVEGQDAEGTPGFTPPKGRDDIEVTPGFTPVEGQDVEDTPGFTPTKGHDVKETPGFTPTEGEDSRRKKAGPGFTVGGTEDAQNAAGPAAGLEAASGEAEAGKKKKKGEAEAEEEDEKSRRFQSPKERAERLKKAQEERRARVRQQQQPEEEEAEEEEAEELDLDSLTHQISLDDIEQYLGMQVLPDDRQKLERRWQQKIRDPSIRQLLTNSKAMEHPYALVPRLPRFFKGGAAVQANMLNLVRNYPQLFDNVAGVINKYRTEPFFVGETPELDWCIVACEALPGSLNRNFMEQKTVVKQYAQVNQTNERRIQRRRLIEILYDCIVINVITKEQILEKTVDLSDSKVGRQNFACVNYGDKGIRINDVGRQQRHPQMGMCPSW